MFGGENHGARAEFVARGVTGAQERAVKFREGIVSHPTRRDAETWKLLVSLSARKGDKAKIKPLPLPLDVSRKRVRDNESTSSRGDREIERGAATNFRGHPKRREG